MFYIFEFLQWLNVFNRGFIFIQAHKYSIVVSKISVSFFSILTMRVIGDAVIFSFTSALNMAYDKSSCHDMRQSGALQLLAQVALVIMMLGAYLDGCYTESNDVCDLYHAHSQ